MAVIDFQRSRQEYLEAEICSLTSTINAATCRWLLLVGEYDDAKFYADWHMNTMVQWLGWRCSMSASAAREHVRVARALRNLPIIVESFSAGSLSFSQVRAITRVAVPATQRTFIHYAKYLTASELDRLVRGYKTIKEHEEESEDELDEINKRYLRRRESHFWDEDGSLVVMARLDPEDGAIYINALEASKADVPNSNLCEEERQLERGRNAADALVEVCRLALGSTSVGAAEVVIQADVTVLDENTSAGVSESDVGINVPVSRVFDGPHLHPETVRRLTCTDPVRMLIMSKEEPLAIGRKSRTVPWPMRIALKIRDKCCQWSGCSKAVYLDAHHIQFWGEGGETNIDNLILLCRHHHRAVHEGGYAITVTLDGFLFIDPDGNPVARTPKPLPPPTAIEQKVDVDPDASRSLWENLRIDYGYLQSGIFQDEFGHD